MENDMKLLNTVAFVLLVIGGINWGLIGLLDLNIVARLLGAGTTAANIVYILVGLSALYSITFFHRVKNA